VGFKAFRECLGTQGGRTSSGVRSKEDLVFPKGAVKNKEGEGALGVHYVLLEGTWNTYEQQRIPYQVFEVRSCTIFLNGFILKPRFFYVWKIGQATNTMILSIKTCVTHTNSSRRLIKYFKMISRHQNTTLQIFSKYNM